MKRFITGIIALAALATANAQTPISSVNAAGYIKVSVEENKFYFLQVPFNKFDGGTYTLDEVFGNSLPDGSNVYVWNQAEQKYDIANYIDGLGWLDNLSLARGQGFFVTAAPGGSAASYDIFLAGEVPGASTAATTTQSFGAGFTALGFPYPVATTLNNLGLNDVTADGDSVYAWNPANQNYAIYNRLDVPGIEWNGDEGAVIQPGSALFLQSASAGSYVAQVPYSWPNN